MDEQQYLKLLQSKLLGTDSFKDVVLTKEWVKSIPAQAGVYIFTQDDKIVYVGETGNLRGRMKDLLDSRHHTVRRTIGLRFFSEIEGFIKATNRAKFPEHVELLVNKHISEKLRISYLSISLGRKELEEQIMQTIEKDIRLNLRGKRK
jgi:excinuclease UvrABC nuclease subunit